MRREKSKGGLEIRNIRLVERDYCIMNEIYRWRYCLSRQIKILCGFSGQRATDRRLKILIDAEYIERQHILYGVPSVYSLTYKAKQLLNLPSRKDKIKVEQIQHDISVIDTVIYFKHIYNLSLSDFMSEKQLHSLDGFSNRVHKPDFIFQHKNQTYCAEVELNIKAQTRFEKNIKDNYLKYDYQNWIVPSSKVKITQILNEKSNIYPNIKIISLEEVQSYVRNI